MKYNEKNKPLVCMQTTSRCYKGTRKMEIKGVLWHDTGANNPNLKRYVQPSDNAPDRAEMLALLGKNQYNNDWNHTDRQAGMNCWVGKLADGTVTTVQTMPWDYRPWGSGSGSKGSCNDHWIQFEICEDGKNDRAYLEAAYKEACEITAYLCKMFGIDPHGTVDFKGMKVPTILCHQDSYKLGLGSNHSDIYDWFPKFGKSMETARDDVAALLAADGTSAPVAKEGLTKGDKGEAVKAMQTMLIACGYSCGSTGVDGDFGKNTLAGLIAFQTAAGLTADGVYGEADKAALEKAYAAIPQTTPTTPATPTSPVTDEEKFIWDTLFAAIQNPFGVSGLMGNLKAESNLHANNLQNNGNKALGMTDDEFIAAFDSGAYPLDTFIHDGYGVGLAQWTYYSRKAALAAYAKDHGVSIGDLPMQLGFLIQEIKGYKAVWNTLVSASSVREASDSVLTKYERPADQSTSVQEKRAGYGQTFYEKYANKETSQGKTEDEPTEQATGNGYYASAVIAVAIAEIGYKEKASNSNLDDKTANAGSANYTKYARDFDQKFPNWYNGKKNGFAWCDMFVDWCFLTAFGYENALRLTCQPEKSAGAGCKYSLRYYKNKGQFHTSGPKPGDQIFFGTSLDDVSHTGLVEKADGSKVYTIEGNTSNQVARRSYALSNSRILGYGRPAYDAEGSTQPTQPATPTTPTTTQYYRVRTSWQAKSSQVGAFCLIQNAINCAQSYGDAYHVYDEAGVQVWPEQKATPEESSDVSFRVRVSVDDLRIRKGAGTDTEWTGHYTGKGVFTILQVLSGQGSDSGWGRLKSGAGWISLDYATRI